MPEDCITKNTKPFVINVENPIYYDPSKIEEYETISNHISEETGVPKKLIFVAPDFFFVDRWHKIDGEWYFFKDNGCYDVYFINDLLGEVISEYFGLDTIHYQVGKLCIEGKKDRYGLVSKNFCDKKYAYKTAWDFNFKARCDLEILETIRNVCKSEEEYVLLLNDIKKFLIRDFYTAERDRTGNNFLFRVGDDGIRLAPLYDYERSFDSINLQFYRNQIAEINLVYSEVRILLRNDDVFQQLLNLIMQANMASFIEQVEDKHHVLIKDNEKRLYMEHDKEIKKIIKQRELIR